MKQFAGAKSAVADHHGRVRPAATLVADQIHDGEGFAHAIDVGVDLVIHGFNDKVKQEFSRFEGSRNGGDSAAALPPTAPIGIEQPQ